MVNKWIRKSHNFDALVECGLQSSGMFHTYIASAKQAEVHTIWQHFGAQYSIGLWCIQHGRYLYSNQIAQSLTEPNWLIIRVILSKPNVRTWLCCKFFIYMSYAIQEFVQSRDCAAHLQNSEIACQSQDCAANLETTQDICTISRLQFAFGYTPHGSHCALPKRKYVSNLELDGTGVTRFKFEHAHSSCA